MLVKEIVYMVLDLAKAATSDDSYFNEDHVLLKKYRSFLIKKEQEKQKATTDIASEFEYQQICLDLEKAPAIDGEPCTGGYYLRTTKKIPKILEDNQPRVYPIDFYQGINISYVPRDKMRYIGTNKFLQNIIYVSLGPDLHLYLNSSNPQFLYLKKLSDVLDEVFPIREYLVPTLIELVVKELTSAKYQPVDDKNNASDDMSKVSTKQS